MKFLLDIRNVGKAGWIWESTGTRGRARLVLLSSGNSSLVFIKTLNCQNLKSAKIAWKSLEEKKDFLLTKAVVVLLAFDNDRKSSKPSAQCWIFLWHCCPLGDAVLSHWEVSPGVKALHLYLKCSSSSQIFANQAQHNKEPVVISFHLPFFFFPTEKLFQIFLLCRPMTAQPAAHSFSMNTLNCLIKLNIKNLELPLGI